MTIRSLEQLAGHMLGLKIRTRLAVAACAEDFVIQACLAAYEKGLVDPIFVGDQDKVTKIAERLGADMSPFERHHETEPAAAVDLCIKLYKAGDAGAIMKGKVNTDVLLRGVLNKETGVPPTGVLSHVGVFNAPCHDKLMILTDAGINIAPNLQRKADILRNALKVAGALGIEAPRVAMLAATEKVIYPAMPATLDAQMVAKMGEQGEFGDALVAGPFALDLAVSARAVECKGVDNPVAGNADVLVAPDIESGNILYKALTSMMNIEMAGIVAGSSVPVVLPSRGDTDRTKFYSIALATLMAVSSKEAA
ncbi:bifunctional enoyl-CoA hydratase/phosphate acetyltransferase [Desulfovibrio subterraneus]|uniref:Phosphate butyryltransferase n=1 Tax=Desulfovibrio subterraneus TaxID=2718620 RepID=A0A7J0BEW9_9BACT|nr:bifunctional enoyl-CoA hydratase/phosphate acetyltransferase [Desulfovibrio subterraneus]WBF68876.1 bifunctional enoyl-CoA hydratase/phosphate acetyltransferase [Desulfovibrio subterraneus]GFM32078.1 phosphate butyryltransferase [Desulfovibrio subterraneus]